MKSNKSSLHPHTFINGVILDTGMSLICIQSKHNWVLLSVQWEPLLTRFLCIYIFLSLSFCLSAIFVSFCHHLYPYYHYYGNHMLLLSASWRKLVWQIQVCIMRSTGMNNGFKHPHYLCSFTPSIPYTWFNVCVINTCECAYHCLSVCIWCVCYNSKCWASLPDSISRASMSGRAKSWKPDLAQAAEPNTLFSCSNKELDLSASERHF